jgi:hypothetical protein
MKEPIIKRAIFVFMGISNSYIWIYWVLLKENFNTSIKSEQSYETIEGSVYKKICESALNTP